MKKLDNKVTGVRWFSVKVAIRACRSGISEDKNKCI